MFKPSTAVTLHGYCGETSFSNTSFFGINMQYAKCDMDKLGHGLIQKYIISMVNLVDQISDWWIHETDGC